MKVRDETLLALEILSPDGLVFIQPYTERHRGSNHSGHFLSSAPGIRLETLAPGEPVQQCEFAGNPACL